MSEAFVPQNEASLTFGGGQPIATLTNLEFSGSTDEIDYTNNDSPAGTGEFIPGKRDPGEVTADFVANSDNAATLHNAWVARTIADVELTFWDSGFEKTGTGFIKDFSITGELKGESVVEGSITIRMVTDEAAGT